MIDQFQGKYTGDVVSVLFSVLSIWIIKYFWDKRDFFKKAAAIPNGNAGLFSMAGDCFGKSVDECLKQTLRYFESSPEVFKVWLGVLVVGVSKPEHMEIVMTNPNCYGKSPLLDFTKPFMGEGLFSAKVEIWKKNRRLINPTFNQKILHSFIPIFQEKTDILIGILEKQVGQPDIDILSLMSRCTLDTICESAMGLRVDAQTSSNHYGKLLDEAMKCTMTRIFHIIYHPNIIYHSSKIGKNFSRVVKEMNSFSQKIIKQRRAIFEQKECDDYAGEEDESRIKTTLELLLEISQNGNHFSDQQLQDEVNTFVSAGSDTTAVTMSFCMLTMALFPEYQQKLYEEAMEVLGEDMSPTKQNLPNLKFTEMFIKETLRIFPIAPFLIRIASDDIELDDLVAPKNSVFLMGIMHLHRNPKYWEDPMKFNPYRFSPEEFAKKHPFSYVPFSGGPRNCIGQRYAMMIMKLILSKIVRKFKVKTDYKSIEEVELTINLMIRPSKGYKMSLELRE